MGDQYYISLADSFGSSAILDFAIEVTNKTPKGKGEGSSALSSITKQEDTTKIPQFIVSPNLIKKQQKMVLDTIEKDRAILEADKQRQQQENNKKSGAWQKLRTSVQRKMMDIQLLDSRRSASESATRASRSQDDTDNGISDTFPHQFQEVLQVSSNSTCSTSTLISEFGDEGRHDLAEERHDDNADRDNDDGMYYIDDELFQIEEGDERRQSIEDDDAVPFQSSSDEDNVSSTINKHIAIDSAPSKQKKDKGNGQPKHANRDKEILKKQLDSAVNKVGKLRKVIQQRSMENSRLNSILDEKNSAIKSKNRKIDVVEHALKSTQDTNKQLEKEVEKLRKQLQAEEMKARGLQSKLDIVARAGTAAASTMMESTANFSTSKASPAGREVIALKERTRVLRKQGSSNVKQGYNALMKASNEGKPMNGESEQNAGEGPAAPKYSRPGAAEQSIISTMAKKFSSKPNDAPEDNRTMRIELEQIRHNLHGKCKNTKSSLEHQWLSKISNAKSQDEDIGEAIDIAKSMKTPTTPAGEQGAFETYFSPLKARIDLIEASCTKSTNHNG